eukprot:CAMPEP_0168620750 /NCGR_PEP_ID=MMETSP0449_2-20121227/7317_1 /TAXON_ID=1082188 /ORGANISM="Strombidium rassoulzadegani, Strain ras09" /LENGTH=76 /DNA_ID=CAMNT_0008661803 /DNA_START=52 /DNA_END=282 /DNA_ORIENTATION=-
MVLLGPGKILPPLAGAFVLATGLYYGMDAAFGGPKPKTVTDPAWAAATKTNWDNWERSDSGASPVKMNPISRGCDP